LENVPTSTQPSPRSQTGTGEPATSTPGAELARGDEAVDIEPEVAAKLDKHSLEAVVELKISRFLEQIGTYYPENLHSLIMQKVEKPLISQILRRTGGNQVHASKILGINRNTLRKKMKMYGLAS
jgi:DNA-binding protein Fis